MSRSRLFSLILLVSLLSPGIRARAPQNPSSRGATPILDPPKVTEFPFADQQVWWLQNRGLLAKSAALRLARAPYERRTIEMLTEQHRYDDVMRLLRGSLQRGPAEMIEVLAGLGFRARDLANEKSRPYAAELGTIVTDANARLTRMPREQAGRAPRAS